MKLPLIARPDSAGTLPMSAKEFFKVGERMRSHASVTEGALARKTWATQMPETTFQPISERNVGGQTHSTYSVIVPANGQLRVHAVFTSRRTGAGSFARLTVEVTGQDTNVYQDADWAHDGETTLHQDLFYQFPPNTPVLIVFKRENQGAEQTEWRRNVIFTPAEG